MLSPEPMAWRVRLEGQPPSTNHLYIRRGSRVIKAPDVESYQVGVTLVVRTSKPRDFDPQGQIRIRYWMYLGRDIDADNVLKALNDAIAYALKVDDRRFLPCVMEKSFRNPSPYIEVEISG